LPKARNVARGDARWLAFDRSRRVIGTNDAVASFGGLPTFAAGVSRHVARVTVEAWRRRRPRQSGVTEALFIFEGP
jgi:hypothetical protein